MKKQIVIFLALMVSCTKGNLNFYHNGDGIPIGTTSDEPANCYVLSKGDEVTFKAVKGNSQESVGEVTSVKVLWESFGTNVQPNIGDVVKDVSYSDNQITVISGEHNGNAVVAAFHESTILWSWHIWVCEDFDPAKTAQVYNNNAGTMMDRNLGATSAAKGDVRSLGLLYQWGRKDPFLNSSGISSSTVAKSTISWPHDVQSTSSTGTIAYAVAHPTTFITYNSSNYDWYYTGSSSTDNTRWRTSDKEKGMYDPCPAGWRVPDSGSGGVWSKAFGRSSYWSTASNWDSTNKGMDFGKTDRTLGSGTVWYPAAGYRDGSLLDVGYGGIYWSCTPYGGSAYFLNFNDSGYVDPSYNYDRAYGLSVRCLSE